MDYFAQTREPDNLFEDDFTPIAEPITTHHVHSYSPTPQHAPRGRHTNEPSSTSPNPPPNPSSPTKTTSAGPTVAGGDNTDLSQPVRPPTAVRGDRSATGGINKPKLTEAELSSRLAAAKLNNARREEAHRAAEADEASFHRREAQASQKRREEGAARRAMEGEREKNRLRKLGARDGREWDEGKQEQEITSATRGGSQYRRGMHGGTTAYRSNFGGREQNEFEEGYGYGGQEDFGRQGYGRQRGGGRGRGGDRSRGGGRGRGRGWGGQEGGRGGGYEDGSYSSPAVGAARRPAINAETDFPSLHPTTSIPEPKLESKPSSSNPSTYPHNNNTPGPANGTKNLDSSSADISSFSPRPSRTSLKQDVEPFLPVIGNWCDEVEDKTNTRQW